uniref:SWIM-type domain-containing protein n=1 Tax=Oryza sativa subsp. japonica TaxID=39947 RepID=Q9FWK9_ORYSJ|nr:hypothetical protein [Oryza sativa Japonica Group]
MADEGERVGIIVDEMEREDSDNEEADDDASSDEEGDVMATDWANEDFSGLVISEGDHVPWEYKENEVIDGARYAHKDEMKEANGWDEKGLPAKWPDVRSRWCMRHMGANFYKQFKNKHLMELFKRLCAQNQEKKFNELWDKLDELTTKQTDEQSRRPQVEGDEPPIPLGALHDDPPTMRRRSGSSIRNFTQWIENEPKEKWSLLFDTDGSRYGIMTTNLAEVYNWVMRGVRILPLVAIVEFILHGTQAYFRDRYKKIGLSMADNNIVFGNVVTKRGIYRKQAVQECVLKADGGCTCSCMKPKLHHLPCSHVLAAAGGRTLRCSKCDLRGHTYKKCPKNAEVPSGADASPSGQASDGMAYDTPALLNRGIDRNHRSFLSAVEGAQLGTFHPRTSREWLRVDLRHVPWYALVEAAADDRDPAKRWDADRSLLAALVDRWRPETHTFHLPCGEMAPTLQDVSYLLGLPLAGAPVGPVDGVFGWKEDITARFEQVMLAPTLQDVSYLLGLPLAGAPVGPVDGVFGWKEDITARFEQADLLHPDADDNSVRRSLEAYLLWLFGWVMFTSTHGHVVDFRLVHYARSIADAQPQDVPQWSWGSAVLAATYRALCEACTKTDAGVIIAGCPMLLQLWAAEKFAIGRPVVDSAPYGVGRSAQWPEDCPTMGTYWCRRGRRYAHVQVRRGYPDFVFEFDRLQPSDVIWEPYTEEAVAARAPLGLSSLCTRDQAYWLTILPMVFDIFVEPHCPQRVMRQFGLRQLFPGNVQPTVLPADHSLTRRGQLAGALWAPRVQQYVDDWVLATEEVINELFPHTEENYHDYLRWYLPRTRARVTFTPDAPEPHVAVVTDAYPTHRDRDYFVGADAARDISADITAVQVRLNRAPWTSYLQLVRYNHGLARLPSEQDLDLRYLFRTDLVCLRAPLASEQCDLQHRTSSAFERVRRHDRRFRKLRRGVRHLFGRVRQLFLSRSVDPSPTRRDLRYWGLFVSRRLEELQRRTLRSSQRSHLYRQDGLAVPYPRTDSRTPRGTLGRRTYRPMCNFIEWVDMENPQNDGTRAYPRSETRSDYLRWKDEHERRIAAEALEWHGNPRMGGFTRWIDNVTPSYHGQKIT